MRNAFTCLGRTAASFARMSGHPSVRRLARPPVGVAFESLPGRFALAYASLRPTGVAIRAILARKGP